MADPAVYLPTQIRRLARIVKAERRVATATATALAELAEVVKTQLAADGYTAVVVDNRAPEWRAALVESIMPVIAEVYDQGYASESRAPAVTAAAETAAEGFDARSPADRYAGQYLGQVENRLTGVADDVFRRITTALEDGRQATFTVTGMDGVTTTETGESIKQLAARVNDLLGNEVWAKRGTVVARTEVISANNAGSQAAARDNAALFGTGEGSVIKEWLATSDTRTRETHQTANHQTVMGLTAPFSVGGYAMQIPGDPAAPAALVVNCRCTALYHYPGDPGYDEMAAELGATLTSVPDLPAPTFGRVLTDPERRAEPLKGIGGSPMNLDEWNDAPFSKADQDFRYIADPDDRATGVLQYWVETEQAAKGAAANLRAGREALDGIDLSDAGFSHLIGDGYKVADLEADITATGRWLVDAEASEKNLGTVYRGIQFDGSKDWDEVRSLIRNEDWNYVSATPRDQHAWYYAGRPDRTRSVIFEIENAKGIVLDSVGNHAIEREFLLSGRIEVVDTELRPDPDGWGDRMYVKARFVR